MREREEKRCGRRRRKEEEGVEEAAEVEKRLEVGMAVEREEIDIVNCETEKIEKVFLSTPSRLT